MHTTEHTDLDGDALTIHRDKGLAWITLTRGGEEMTVGPVHADVLEARGGHSRRSDVDPVPIINEVARLDGELHETRNRAEEAEDTLSLVQQQRDQAVGRAEKAEKRAALWKETAREHIGRARTALSYADAAQLARAVASVTPCSCSAQRARAEKAERERDEARGALRARLGVLAEPRPLTPDAITEEQRQRGYDTLRAFIYEGNRVESSEVARRGAVVEVIKAVLTEPPQRPDGAEELEAWFAAAWKNGGDWSAAADLFARKGLRAPVALAEVGLTPKEDA